MIGRLTYAFTFCILLPALLLLWAVLSDQNVHLQAPYYPLLTWTLFILGSAIVLSSMWTLMRYGKGLPMNAYPPKEHVTQGLYKFFNHPIYVGACIVYISIAMYSGNSSAFWLGCPVFILSCIALVYGYENERIRSLFGLKSLSNKWSLPAESDVAPTSAQRFSAYIKLFLPWLALYELRVFLGPQLGDVDISTNWESSISVIEWTTLIYVATYPFVLLVPVLASTQRQLRSFLIDGYLLCLIGFFLMYVFPFMSPFRAFNVSNIWGELLQYERSMDSPYASFPAFHVLWALAAGKAFAQRFASRRWFWYLSSVAIAVSCITTGLHAVVEVTAAFVVFGLVHYRNAIALRVRAATEGIANSWREWHFGGLRIISHSIWPGVACVVGLLVANTFIHNVISIALVCIVSLIGAALWGQFVEGSPRLLRPFGYYGSVLGGILGVLLAQFLFHESGLVMLSALAVASPWIQAIGRIRCWVQGCCHGSITASPFGIVYSHPKSRVNKISGLLGKPLYNTQLFSIVTNCLIGTVLIRLVYSEQSPSLMLGLYLILNGISRFIEESMRGESQTKELWGLRLYQWFAILSVLVGIGATCIATQIVLRANFAFTTTDRFVVLGCSLVAAFAMGMDFPRSNVRFSRLAD